MSDYYTLDEDGQPVPCNDILEWGRWFKTADRRVSEDLDEGEGAERIRVSTVFLAIDHSFSEDALPVLWETLVFGGPLDGEMYRYTSLEDAVIGHQLMCQRVREALGQRQGTRDTPDTPDTRRRYDSARARATSRRENSSALDTRRARERHVRPLGGASASRSFGSSAQGVSGGAGARRIAAPGRR